MPEDRAVLITRPEPGASETAARVAALGFQPVVAPLLEVRALRPRLPPPGRLQAVLATSGNAVAALPAGPRGRRRGGGGGGAAWRARAVLRVSGRGQGGALAAELRARGFRVVRRVVYEAVAVPALPEAARARLAANGLHAALFFSAETARHAVRLLRRAGLQEAVRGVEALAIGRPAAVALQALPWRRIRVAARPNQDAMLALLR